MYCVSLQLTAAWEYQINNACSRKLFMHTKMATGFESLKACCYRKWMPKLCRRVNMRPISVGIHGETETIHDERKAGQRKTNGLRSTKQPWISLWVVFVRVVCSEKL